MKDIATDPNGYSYVVGQSYDSTGFMGFPTTNGGGFLAKISPDGSVLWSQAFTHASFDQIEFKNNTLYATGHGNWNIVVGAHTFNVDSTRHGYLVAAFDTTGTDIWVNCSEYTADMSSGDIDANAAGELFIAASGYSPIITATDTFTFAPYNRQILVIKYSATGQLEWISVAGCTWSKSRALGIACDELGSAYVTGFGSTYSPDCEEVQFGLLSMPYPSTFYLTKIDGNGDFIWLRHGYGGVGKDVEYVGDDTIAVIGYFYDSTNAVGSTPIQSQGTDMFIGSFDLAGNPGWYYRSEVANDSSLCQGIRLDLSSHGELYALSQGLHTVLFDGDIVNTVGHGLQVSRFSRQGIRYWSATMSNIPGSPDNYIEPFGLSSDSSGIAYASGQFVSQDGPDPFLAWSTDSIQGTLNDYTLFVARTSDVSLGTPSTIEFARSIFYPNPTTGILTITELREGTLIAVLDLSGRVVLEGRGAKNYLDIGSLSDGVYLIRCQDGKGVHLARVVLRR